MTCGIYKIVNKVNGKFYIGSSKDIEYRWRVHIREANGGRHHSPRFQNSWNYHGKDNFTFEIIELCDYDVLLEKEQTYLNELRPWDSNIGYNISQHAGGGDNIRHHPNRDIIIEKIRQSALRQQERMTEAEKKEIAKKISNSLKGRTFSELHSKRKSLAQTGNKNHQYGIEWSDERREAQSKRMKGKNNCHIMRSIQIDNVIYESVMSACRILKLERHIIRYRLASKKFPNYNFIQP
jgi:group I intron endonuclease